MFHKYQWALMICLGLVVTAAADPQPVMLRDIHPGTDGSNIRHLTAASMGVHFSAWDGVGQAAHSLWLTDGTAGGTQRLHRPGQLDPFSPEQMTEVSGIVFMIASENELDNPHRLYSTRGTNESTVIYSNTHPSTSVVGPYLWGAGGKIFFNNYELEYGHELWVSDGTAEGTHMIIDNEPGSLSASPYFLTERGGWLYYFIMDSRKLRIGELWRTNGTTDDTKLVINFRSKLANAWPQGMVCDEYILYIPISNLTSAQQLWILDWSTGSFQKICEDWSGQDVMYLKHLTPAGGKVYFAASLDDTGVELWVSDGTADGTLMVADIQPGTEGSYPDNITPIGDKAYFIADDGVHGREVWVTEGTADSTHLVRDIRAGVDSADPGLLTEANRLLYFTADDGYGRSLWKSDGRIAEQVAFADPEIVVSEPDPVWPIEGDIVRRMAYWNGYLFFKARTPNYGEELWALWVGKPLSVSDWSLCEYE